VQALATPTASIHFMSKIRHSGAKLEQQGREVFLWQRYVLSVVRFGAGVAAGKHCATRLGAETSHILGFAWRSTSSLWI